MPILVAENLQKAYGPRSILDHVSLSIHSAERVGLVGNNGSGKSTLARILARLEETDTGTIRFRRDARIVYLAQNPNFTPGVSALRIVLDGLELWCQARDRYETATSHLRDAKGETLEAAIAEQASAASEVERLGGWECLHQAEAMLHQLGIQDTERALDEMSGGEVRRVALARALLAKPELLILDEPTNHLDLSSIEWLENYLCDRFAGAILLITHDRRLLDRVTTRTLELHDGVLDAYQGGYASYLEGKALREAHNERVESNRQNFLRRELEWLRRQPKARAGKQKARIQRAEAVLEARMNPRERLAELHAQASRTGKSILRLDDVGLHAGEKALFSGLELELRKGERIGIVGPNGSGKTTLLRCIFGEIQPTTGRLLRGKNTQMAYLDQARSQLDPDETVFKNVAQGRERLKIGETNLTVRAHLERFLFDSQAQRKFVGTLSGGERARVALAKLLAEECNLLLLDEPTNDLDVSTLSALEAMLQEFDGTVFIVSHDRWLLDRVASSILVLDGEGGVEISPGNYSAYEARRELRLDEASPAKKSPSSERNPANEPKRRRALRYGEKLELEGILDKISAAEEIVQALEVKLADPLLYEGESDAATQLAEKFEAAKTKLDQLVARWEELEAKKQIDEAPETSPN